MCPAAPLDDEELSATKLARYRNARGGVARVGVLECRVARSAAGATADLARRGAAMPSVRRADAMRVRARRADTRRSARRRGNWRNCLSSPCARFEVGIGPGVVGGVDVVDAIEDLVVEDDVGGGKLRF